MANEYQVNPVIPFVLNKGYKTRKATIKQNASATADLKAGTLLFVDADGKMNPVTGTPSGATFTGTPAELTGEAQTYTPAGTVALGGSYPCCVLLNDVAKEVLIAGDATADVVYQARVSKSFISSVNSGLTINDAFIWNTMKNGIDIYELA